MDKYTIEEIEAAFNNSFEGEPEELQDLRNDLIATLTAPAWKPKVGQVYYWASNDDEAYFQYDAACEDAWDNETVEVRPLTASEIGLEPFKVPTDDGYQNKQGAYGIGWRDALDYVNKTLFGDTE